MTHEEQNAKLIQQHLAGDNDARDQLIVGNQTLIKATVRRMLNAYPEHNHLRHDLISEGYVALVQLVDGLIEPPISSFRNLVISAVRHAVLKVLQRKEEPYYNTHVHSGGGVDTVANGSIYVENNDVQRFEDREFLLAYCANNQERRILELYFEYHTLQEVATQLGSTRRKIKRILKQYRARTQVLVGVEFR